MSVAIILFWIVVATAVVLLLIMKLNINPTIALCVGALGLGIACNVGLSATAATIGSGFGSLMTSLGLPIGFGVILGELLSECGGCRVIAKTMLKGVGPKMAIWACCLTGFILSVPVFFDVAFIILCPLCVEISKEIKKPLPYTIGPMSAGALVAHHLVPPTPTPMLVPDYFNVSLGEMVLFGAIIGAVVIFITVKIYLKLLDHGFWNPATCENTSASAAVEVPLPEKLPSFGTAMIPILLPVVLIILSTVTGAMGIQSEIISFVSNKNVAMLLGALSAYFVASVNLDGSAREKAATKAMGDSGLVMLITGAGGSFAAVIGATGLAAKLGEALAASNALTPLVLCLVGYGIGAIFLVALGSGTTAAITSMTVLSGIIASSGMQINSELWPALACLAGGGLSLHHINDSGFWVVTNISGFKPLGGFKTYSTTAFIMSILVMVVAIVGCLVIG